MYDGTVGAAYLREHPALVEDYLDYFSIRRWRFYQHLVKSNSEQAKKSTDEHAAELKAEYDKVLPKFTKPGGKQVYDSWRKGVSLRQMAEAVHLGELYPVFYSMASGIQHVDVSGMGHQIADGLFDVAVAPNEKFVREALNVGHNMSVRALYEFNLVGQLGHDDEIDVAGKKMVAVWKALKGNLRSSPGPRGRAPKHHPFWPFGQIERPNQKSTIDIRSRQNSAITAHVADHSKVKSSRIQVLERPIQFGFFLLDLRDYPNTLQADGRTMGSVFRQHAAEQQGGIVCGLD